MTTISAFGLFGFVSEDVDTDMIREDSKDIKNCRCEDSSIGRRFTPSIASARKDHAPSRNLPVGRKALPGYIPPLQYCGSLRYRRTLQTGGHYLINAAATTVIRLQEE